MNEIPNQIATDPLTFEMIVLGIQKFMVLPDGNRFKAGDKILISAYNTVPIKREIEFIFHGDGNALKEGFCILQISE
jgi:hypothetical protein